MSDSRDCPAKLPCGQEAPGEVIVEFFGIPRMRAQLKTTQARGACLSEVLADLARRFPQLADACIAGDQLRPGIIANLGGDRFITDPTTRLAAGQRLLIMSADAGG